MNKKIITSISFLFILLFALSPAIALTNVTENIRQDTTWDTSGSPYIIESDIQVYPSTTLTVEPGVEVVIHVGASLIIGGELIARGEPTNLIIFKSNVTVPDPNPPAGIIFESTAASARFLGGFKPIFSYDHTNREVKLTYESGSILEYCLISGLPTAIELNSSYPYISQSRITGCPYGIRIFGSMEIPIQQWFFLYRNTIENCSQQAMFVEGWDDSLFTLFTGNIIQSNVDNDQAWAAYLSDLSENTFLFLFNNRIINNKGTGIVSGGAFLYADNNEIAGNDQGLSAGNAVLLNNTITNNDSCSYPVWATAKGGGVYLHGPRAVLFNNTIQANEICPGGQGDNIMLKSREGNQFTIQYNNIGSSNGDQIDLYLDTDYQEVDCNTSDNIIVDATQNFWENRDINNLPDNIYDFTDDFCAGTVNYQPILSTKMSQINLTTPPTLIAPEPNAFKPGTLTLNFSWEPVIGATKYLLCTNGNRGALPVNEPIRIKEVQGQSSAEITYSPFTSYAQEYIYWFVVAGNENGWSLPSEIRKVYFSMDPYIVRGKVLDENEIPVPELYIRGEGQGVFSDDNGNYTTIQRDEFKEGLIYSLKKEGFSDCYTFPRLSESFDTFGNLTIISNAAKDAIYNACGEITNATKGTIAGIVVDKNDQALTGAEVFIEPPSGNIYYLDANNSPDLSLAQTGSPGKFVILNVAPGGYRISANLDGRNFSIIDNWGEAFIGPGIIVYENSITVDALVDKSDLGTGEGGGNFVTSDLWIKAVINTEEKGPIEAVWQKGGEDTTSRGDRVIWGHFYASPSDVTWGSSNNPDLFVKIWFDVSGRVDVNYFHVSVPDIEVYSDYPYDGSPDEQGTTTMDRRYIRQYYENGRSYSDENYEDGNPPSGYSPSENPSGYSTINDLRIGSIINTEEKGPIDAIWQLGGQDTTSRGDHVVWGHFYASPSDVTWGSENNPDLFVKIWFDVSGRTDVNFFHVSVPDIEVYSALPDDGTYDQQGTTIMDNRYIRHEYHR